MRYLILGAGALGGLFGGKLLKGGADVTFLVRPGRAAQLTRDGLVVKAQDGEIRTPVKTLQQGELNGTYDVILVCCKAYDLDGAMEAIAPAVGKDSAIVPLLNGVRHIDTLSKRFGLQHVVGGLTAINAALLPDGVIQQSQLRVSMNILGELDGRLTPRCGQSRRPWPKAASRPMSAPISWQASGRSFSPSPPSPPSRRSPALAPAQLPGPPMASPSCPPFSTNAHASPAPRDFRHRLARPTSCGACFPNPTPPMALPS